MGMQLWQIFNCSECYFALNLHFSQSSAILINHKVL